MQCLKNKQKIFHTLAHLDQVAWLVSSWIRSLAQHHHVAQVNFMLILPKAPHTSHGVERWGSLKAFGEVTNTTWAIEGTIWGTLSFFAKFSKNSKMGSIKEEEWEMQSQKPFYSLTSEGMVESHKPHGWSMAKLLSYQSFQNSKKITEFVCRYLPSDNIMQLRIHLGRV
jgi:hypothetical protein